MRGQKSLGVQSGMVQETHWLVEEVGSAVYPVEDSIA